MQEYTTSKGVTIRFRGIASALDVLNGQFRDPDPPTYSRLNAGKVWQTFPHDETTLEDPDGDPAKTAANQAAWAEYLAELKRVREAHQEALARLCLLKGIECEMPADEAWVHEQQVIGFHVPDDPVERRLHYLTTEVADVADTQAIVLGVFEASGVTEEQLSQMADSFRHPVAQPNGHEAGGPAVGTGAASVVLQPAVRAGRRRNQKRHPPHERVRRVVAGGQGLPGPILAEPGPDAGVGAAGSRTGNREAE